MTALLGVFLGLCVLLAVRPPFWMAMAVGKFSRRSKVTTKAANPSFYALGFVVATGMLHLCSIGIGYLWQRNSGQAAGRAAGGAITVAGAAFLTSFT